LLTTKDTKVAKLVKDKGLPKLSAGLFADSMYLNIFQAQRLRSGSVVTFVSIVVMVVINPGGLLLVLVSCNQLVS
jgi:hypothetical protein